MYSDIKEINTTKIAMTNIAIINIETNSKDSADARLRKIRYRSWHRGCKETDEVLGNFADSALHELQGEAELDLYEELLDEQDVNIWDWLTDKSMLCDGKYNVLKQRLLVFAKYSAHEAT